MLAGLADVVHDRPRADSREPNRDEENDQEVLLIDLAPPAAHPRNFRGQQMFGAAGSCGYLGCK